jgi:signal transduction histidine kinase
VESRLRAADGNYRWFLMLGEPLRNAQGSVVRWFGTCTDIEDLKQAEEALKIQEAQLRALTTRLQQVREEERAMVARDLHDQIGQILTAIKMDMTWLARRLPEKKGEAHDRIKKAIELISDGARSMRKICSGLRPGILDDLGLAAAIEWQAGEFASRTGVSCQVSLPQDDLRLDGDLATAIFRIFQESLTNVARHAEAQAVRASLYTQNGNLLLVVVDDGKGFREAEISGSLGLLGMKERAQACGGDLQISSSPGDGTTVTVRVPLHSHAPSVNDHAHSNSR